MADNEEGEEKVYQKNEEGEEIPSRGSEWEVVSLTASAYAAAPGPEQVDLNDDEGNPAGKAEAETSNAMFMSRHFVFPPSQHENLPLEPENSEICSEQGTEDVTSQLVGEGKGKFLTKNEEDLNIEGLTASGKFPEIPIFDEKGNMLSVSGTDFEENTAFQGLNLVGKEQSFYGEATMSEPAKVEDREIISESIETFDRGLDSEVSDLPTADEYKYNGPPLPCEAWWKRHAASLYAHAKEANAFWSIFIAAAVMGLVILGQQWQQERWQVLQHKWQFGINEERMGRMLGPITRLKDVIVGGQRRSSFIRGSAPTER